MTVSTFKIDVILYLLFSTKLVIKSVHNLTCGITLYFDILPRMFSQRLRIWFTYIPTTNIKINTTLRFKISMVTLKRKPSVS